MLPTIKEDLNIAQAILAAPEPEQVNIPFVKLDHKTGEWTLGEGDVLNDEGDPTVIMDMASLHHGWKWQDDDGKWHDDFVPVSERVPDAPDPDDKYTTEPRSGYKVLLILLGSGGEGEPMVYSTSSKSGTQFIAKLLTKTKHRLMKNPNDPCIHPLFTLGVESYKHKKFGMIHKPCAHNVKWVDRSGAFAGG